MSRRMRSTPDWILQSWQIAGGYTSKQGSESREMDPWSDQRLGSNLNDKNEALLTFMWIDLLSRRVSLKPIGPQVNIAKARVTLAGSISYSQLFTGKWWFGSSLLVT